MHFFKISAELCFFLNPLRQSLSEKILTLIRGGDSFFEDKR
jgi:hypothetical protein